MFEGNDYLFLSLSVVLSLDDVPKIVFQANQNGVHKQHLGGHGPFGPTLATALTAVFLIGVVHLSCRSYLK